MPDPPTESSPIRDGGLLIVKMDSWPRHRVLACRAPAPQRVGLLKTTSPCGRPSLSAVRTSFSQTSETALRTTLAHQNFPARLVERRWLLSMHPSTCIPEITCFLLSTLSFRSFIYAKHVSPNKLTFSQVAKTQFLRLGTPEAPLRGTESPSLHDAALPTSASPPASSSPLAHPLQQPRGPHYALGHLVTRHKCPLIFRQSLWPPVH